MIWLLRPVMRVDRLYASNNGGVTQTNNTIKHCGSTARPLPLTGPLFIGVSLVIYCGSTAGPLHLTGHLFICVSLRNLEKQRAHSASAGSIYGPAVDPLTNTCETVISQDLTGRQWIRKIQRACMKSAKSIYGRARSRSSVDPQTNTSKTVDPQDPTGLQSIREIQRACCRSAMCPRRTVYLPFPVCSPDAQASRCDTATSETTATICRPDSTSQRAALVGPQIRTAFCRNPLKPTTNTAFYITLRLFKRHLHLQ